MTLESTVERHFKLCVDKLGGMAVKFVPTYFAGFPDRIVLLPRGRIVFVELRAQGKKPRALQLKVHERLRELGFQVDVIDSIDEVNKWASYEAAKLSVSTRSKV